MLLLPSCANYCFSFKQRARSLWNLATHPFLSGEDTSDGKGTSNTTEGRLMLWRNPRPGRTRKKRSQAGKIEDIEEIHRAFPPPKIRAEWHFERVLQPEYSAEPSDSKSAFGRPKAALIVQIWKLSTKLGLEKNKVTELVGKVETLESNDTRKAALLATMTEDIQRDKDRMTWTRKTICRILLETIPEHHKIIAKPEESDSEYIVRAVSDLSTAYKTSQASLETPLNKRQQARVNAEKDRRVKAEENLASLIKSKDGEDKCKSDQIVVADAKTASAEAVAGKARDDLQLSVTALATEKDSHASTKQLLDAKIIENRDLTFTMTATDASLKTAVSDKNEAVQKLREEEKEHSHTKARLGIEETNKRRLKQEIDKFQKQKGRLQTRNQELEGLHKVDQKEFEDLKAAKEKAKAAADVNFLAHQESIKEAAKSHALLTASGEDVEYLTKLHDNDQTEIVAGKKREENLAKDLEAHKKEVLENGSLRAQVATANEKMHELEGDNAASQEKIVNFQARGETANKKIHELEGDNVASQEKIVNFQAREETANKKIHELEGDNAASQEKIVTLQARDTAKNEEIHNLKADNAACHEEIRELKSMLAQANCNPGTSKNLSTSTSSRSPDVQDIDAAVDPTENCISPTPIETERVPTAATSENAFKDDAATEPAAEEVVAETIPVAPVADLVPSVSAPLTDEKDSESSADGKVNAVSQDKASEGGISSCDPSKYEPSATEESQSAKEIHNGDLGSQDGNGPVESVSPEEATEIPLGSADGDKEKGVVEDGESQSVKDAQDGVPKAQAGIGPVDDDKPQSVQDLPDDDLEFQEDVEPVEDYDSQSFNNVQDGNLETPDTDSVRASDSHTATDAADDDLEMQEATGSVDHDEPQSVKETQDGSLEVHENTSPVEADGPQQAEDAQVAGVINPEEGIHVGDGHFEGGNPIGDSNGNKMSSERDDCEVPEQASRGDESGAEEQDDDAKFEECTFKGGNPFVVQGDSGDATPVPVDSGTSQQAGQPTENANSKSPTPVGEVSSRADVGPEQISLEDPDRLPEADDDKSACESGVSEAQVSGNEGTQYSGGSDTSLDDNTAFDAIEIDGCDLFGESLDPNAMDWIDFSDSVPSTPPVQQTFNRDQALDGASASGPTPSMNVTPQTHAGNQVMDGNNMPDPTPSTVPTQQTYDGDQVMDGADIPNPTTSPYPIAQVQNEDQVMGGTDIPADNPLSTTNLVPQDGDQIMKDVGGATTTIVPSNGFGSSLQNTQGISPASFVPVIQGSLANPNGSGSIFGQSSVQRKAVVNTNYAAPTVNDGSEDHVMGDDSDSPVDAQPSGDMGQEMDEADELKAAVKSFELPGASGQTAGFTKDQSTAAMPVINTPNRESDFQQAYTDVSSQATDSALTPSSTYVYRNQTAAPQFGGAPAYQDTASSTSTDQNANSNLFNGTSSANPAQWSFQNPVPQMSTPNSSSMPPKQNATADPIPPIFSSNTDQVQEDPGVASRRRANRDNANGRVQSGPAEPSDSINQWGWADRTPDTPEEIAELEADAAEMEAELDAIAAAEEEENKLFAEMEAARRFVESRQTAAEQGSSENNTSSMAQAQDTGSPSGSRTSAADTSSDGPHHVPRSPSQNGPDSVPRPPSQNGPDSVPRSPSQHGSNFVPCPPLSRDGHGSVPRSPLSKDGHGSVPRSPLSRDGPGFVPRSPLSRDGPGSVPRVLRVPRSRAQNSPDAIPRVPRVPRSPSQGSRPETPIDSTAPVSPFKDCSDSFVVVH